MSPEVYLDIKSKVQAAGFAADIDWAEAVAGPLDAASFASEAIFVICNSGMAAVVARKIYLGVMEALAKGYSAGSAFRHPGKVAAIDRIWEERAEMLEQFRATDDKIEYLACLPWIGDITKYHLARNFGVDCVKPDRHLVRIARAYGVTPHELCAPIAEATGDRIGTVDYVLWRAAERRIFSPPLRVVAA